MLADPDATSRVSAPPVPAFKIQSLLAVVASWKIIVPTVREPSSVTVAFAVMFSVLKFAVAPTPPAIVPPVQLVLVAQDPPARFDQVPLVWASAVEKLAA